MKLLSVGLTGTVDEVRIQLQHDCTVLAKEGFSVAVDQIDKGDYTFLGCNIVDGELSFRNYERVKNVLKHYVAKILADQVIDREEKRLIRKIITHNYYYFNPEEQDLLYQNALRQLEASLQGQLAPDSRRRLVMGTLLDYLDTHHELVLDGFVNFRLKDYRDRLTELVDHVVDDYMMELEYKEFIKILKYFVDVQQPRVEEVHVVVCKNGAYRLFDRNGQSIHNQYLESVVSPETADINYEDLLISALISIAPYSVMLHSDDSPRERDVIDTLSNVFEGRVVVCHDCDICRPWR